MSDRCGCGRVMLTRSGDLQATCAECRSLPDSCPCKPLPRGRHAGSDADLVLLGYDPDDPLSPIKKAVKEAPDEDLIPGMVAVAVEAMASFGMDTSTRATMRAYLKKNRQLGVGAADFDAIVQKADKARRRLLSPSHPVADGAHLHTPPSWASDQDILARMVRTLKVCKGLVGENRNAKVTYLAITSRLLRHGDQVNVVTKGLSSSGKSYMTESVVGLFPPEAVYTMTAMSERALIYLDEELAHKTIVLYEATALREGREKAEDNQTAYIVRSLLSEGRIEYPVVMRDEDGTLHTVKLVKEGPTNLVTTTTSISLHPENETRMLSLPSNDSQQQTRAVLIGSAADDPDDAPDFSDWHQFQRWLASANLRVTIPYAQCIALQIPPVAVRLRRDWNSVRALIKSHALIHQLNREVDDRGRIVATTADYAAIRSVVADLVAEGIGATIHDSVRKTVEIVATLANADGVTVKMIEDRLGLERSAAYRRLRTAADKGFIVNVEDKKGRPARYDLGAPMPADVVVLPDPGDVCTGPCVHLMFSEAADQDCACTGVCRCASESTPIETENILEELS